MGLVKLFDLNMIMVVEYMEIFRCDFWYVNCMYFMFVLKFFEFFFKRENYGYLKEIFF